MSVKKGTKRGSLSGNTSEEIQNALKSNFELTDINVKSPFEMSENQLDCLYTLNNPKTNMMFVDGPAGSMKTYLGVLSALEHITDPNTDIRHIIYIRSAVESSSTSLGALPGELEDKFSPYAIPLKEKMGEMVSTDHLNYLFTSNHVEALPINYVRGRTFKNSFVIVDEAQNLTRAELTTILTRIGTKSKYYICGDTFQSDIKKSGFAQIKKAFDHPYSEKNNIHCCKFETCDISRSKILQHVSEILSNLSD